MSKRFKIDSPYQKRYSLYTNPPTETLEMDDFAAFAWKRAEMFKELRTIDLRNHSMVYKITEKYFDLKTVSDVRRDCLSHHMLRLVFHKEEDHWHFISVEKAILKARILHGHFKDKVPMLCFHLLSNGGYMLLRIDQTDMLGQVEDDLKDGYMTYFENALQMVGQRGCVLKQGYALFHKHKLVDLTLDIFQRHLKLSLKAIPDGIQFEDPIRSLIHYISEFDKNIGFSVTENTLEMNEIDEFAENEMPECMKALHKKFRKDHHLKHIDRRPYRLFLKWAGMSLESVTQFWREEHLRLKGNLANFSEHVYGIAHDFGQEGKKKNYGPPSCQTMIASGQCPFSNKGGIPACFKLGPGRTVVRPSPNEFVQINKKK